jgi:hypothetical protein
MRKRPLSPTLEPVRSQDEDWLDLESTAVVEVSSEEKDFPVEAALVFGETRGWRAAEPGSETIRLLFDQPQKVKRIALVFEEYETIRTQEFVLRWSATGPERFRHIVRQQWNFSPPATVREAGGIPRRTLRCGRARTEDRAEHQRRRGVGLAQEVALVSVNGVIQLRAELNGGEAAVRMNDVKPMFPSRLCLTITACHGVCSRQSIASCRSRNPPSASWKRSIIC